MLKVCMLKVKVRSGELVPHPLSTTGVLAQARSEGDGIACPSGHGVRSYKLKTIYPYQCPMPLGPMPKND
jgi:hypothetical protein